MNTSTNIGEGDLKAVDVSLKERRRITSHYFAQPRLEARATMRMWCTCACVEFRIINYSVYAYAYGSQTWRGWPSKSWSKFIHRDIQSIQNTCTCTASSKILWKSRQGLESEWVTTNYTIIAFLLTTAVHSAPASPALDGIVRCETVSSFLFAESSAVFSSTISAFRAAISLFNKFRHNRVAEGQRAGDADERGGNICNRLLGTPAQ